MESERKSDTMKVLYIGTICNREHYEQMLAKSTVKPTIAPLLFETALLNGLEAYLPGNVSILSCPVFKTFPFGRIFGWRSKQEKINDRLSCTWLPAINISGLKEWTQICSVKRYMKKWRKANAGEQNVVVMVYGVNSMAGAIQKMCKKWGAKSVCIIADLPQHTYFAGRKLSLVKKLWAKLVTAADIKNQGGFDGYIYLTEAMGDVVAPGKPYCVIEGVADTGVFESLEDIQRSEKPAILYAGTLAKRYGIKLIMDAFDVCQEDYELWICGSGDYEDAVHTRAKNNPKIKCFGRLSHEDALTLEKKAHLLINIRSNTDEYTKYSFPSKNMEYLLSGTPVASTRLEGIPEEYFQHMYAIHGQTPEEISQEIDSIMADETKFSKAEQAKAFVLQYKSEIAQGKKAYDFLVQLVG